MMSVLLSRERNRPLTENASRDIVRVYNAGLMLQKGFTDTLDPLPFTVNASYACVINQHLKLENHTKPKQTNLSPMQIKTHRQNGQ